jgi:hypothetical protein
LGRNVLWFRTYADQHYWNIINLIYRLTGFGSMPEVVKVDSFFIPKDIVADNLKKNVQLSCFALEIKKAKYVFVLQHILSITSKLLTQDEKDHLEFNKARKEYFIQCYNEIRLRLTKLRIINFTFIDESDVFASLTEKDHIFLDSYHFGDLGNELVAKKIFKGVRPILSIE